MTGTSSKSFSFRESMVGGNRWGKLVNPSLNWFIEIAVARVNKPGLLHRYTQFGAGRNFFFNKGGNAGIQLSSLYQGWEFFGFYNIF